MPVVVELLSSSPPRPNVNIESFEQFSKTTRPRVPPAAFLDIGSSDFEDNDRNPAKSSLNKRPETVSKLPLPTDNNSFRDSRVFDDSLLDNLGSDDFPVEQHTKRRKLSPSPQRALTQLQKSLAAAEAVFDLSSEPDLVSHGAPQVLSFSSSAPLPETSNVANAKAALVLELSSDDGEVYNDPVMSSSQPPMKVAKFSERTNTLLVNLKTSGGRLSVTKSASVRQASQFKSKTKKRNMNAQEDDDNIVDSSQPAAKSSKPAKPATSWLPNDFEDSELTDGLPATSNDRHVPAKGSGIRGQNGNEDKAAEKQRKQLEKDAAKEKKRVEKEQQAAQKRSTAERAEVNRKKTDKKKTSEEMVVKMPYSMKGKSLGNQVEESMKQIDVDTRFYQADVDMSNDGSAPVSSGAIIKWYRKVNSRYNEEMEEYEATPSRTEQEKHVLVYLTAEEFCALAVAGPTGRVVQQHPSEDEMKTNIDTWIMLIRSKHEGVTLVFLLQGLTAYLKKSANTKNREYAAAVRALNPDPEVPSSSATTRPSKKRKSTTLQLDLSFLSSEHIDDLTLHLQLAHQPLHIHHTTSAATSAQQILAFTQHLSTRPYRLSEQTHSLAHASFCMASGQFKTGQGDVTETFLKMLEQVNRITPSMALGIVTEGYDTPRQLVAGFQKIEKVDTSVISAGGSSREAREAKENARLMLQDVRKALNKNGARSDKRIGPAASKRLYKVFMSKDENLRDGIV